MRRGYLRGLLVRDPRGRPGEAVRADLQAPCPAADGLEDGMFTLSVRYRATQAISQLLETDTLLPQILELVFEPIGADRGAIVLKDEPGGLVPKAVRWRGPADPDERL